MSENEIMKEENITPECPPEELKDAEAVVEEKTVAEEEQQVQEGAVDNKQKKQSCMSFAEPNEALTKVEGFIMFAVLLLAMVFAAVGIQTGVQRENRTTKPDHRDGLALLCTEKPLEKYAISVYNVKKGGVL